MLKDRQRGDLFATWCGGGGGPSLCILPKTKYNICKITRGAISNCDRIGGDTLLFAMPVQKSTTQQNKKKTSADGISIG